MNDQTHDYTQRAWGHDFAVLKTTDGGKRIDLSGHGLGIKAGDYMILPNGQGTTRYRIESIDYCSDPNDMWFAKAAFAPRTQSTKTPLTAPS